MLIICSYWILKVLNEWLKVVNNSFVWCLLDQGVLCCRRNVVGLKFFCLVCLMWVQVGVFFSFLLLDLWWLMMLFIFLLGIVCIWLKLCSYCWIVMKLLLFRFVLCLEISVVLSVVLFLGFLVLFLQLDRLWFLLQRNVFIVLVCWKVGVSDCFSVCECSVILL